MKKLTKVKFSEHILSTHTMGEAVIYELKKPDTRTHMVTFINACGVLTVTGDFGNWVFCREFHPGPDEFVSPGYWDEKLHIHSVQKSHKYDSEQTEAELKRFKRQFKSNFGRPMNEEESDWHERLLSMCDEEFDYSYCAYRDKPNTIDYESVPFGTSRHFFLEVVYDAFNEICARMKKSAK